MDTWGGVLKTQRSNETPRIIPRCKNNKKTPNRAFPYPRLNLWHPAGAIVPSCFRITLIYILEVYIYFYACFFRLSPSKGTLLPAGALACVWIYGLHRHPALWESPDSFLPRRWLGGARQVRQ